MRPWGIKRLFHFTSRDRRQIGADISDEFTFHLDMRTEDLVREGLDRASAAEQALREFGQLSPSAKAIADVDYSVERRRSIGRFGAELRQDAALGLRLLARSPGFAAVALLTLALGVGASTAIYSLLDAVLLRPLPYPQADRLVLVSETLENGNQNNVSGGAYLDWRAHQTQFAALTLTGRVSSNLRGAGPPERLRGMEVSHEFSAVLGIPPILGRGFLPEDDRAGGRNDVVVITEELWRSRFGSDPAIVGRSILLDEVPRTIIGVLPKGIWLFKEDTFFVPAVLAPGSDRSARSGHWAAVFGRLAPDATVAQADAELKHIKRQLNGEYPAFKQGWGVRVQPITDVISGMARPPLLVLLGAVSLVLLIACANVANLLIARGCHRQQELAVRAALGASGARLVRQVLTENFTLALLGGAAGILVARAGIDILRPLTAGALPITVTPRLDLKVLLFSLAATVATGPLVGLLPALRARRPDLAAAMSTGSKGAAAAGRQRAQSILVVVEVALTVVLLSSAALLLRSLANAAAADPGLEPARVLAFDVSLPDVSYASGEKRLAFATDLVRRLRTLPGIEGAGTGMAIPFSGGGYGEYFRRPDDPGNTVIGRMDFVSPGYLEALGTRLLAGRRLIAADNRRDGPRVAVISETTMKMFFPKRDAVGQPLTVGGQTWQVVGVVADVVQRRLDTPRGAFAYMPSAFNSGAFSVVVRTPLDPLSLVTTVRAEVARLDPGVAIATPRSLDRAMAESFTPRKVVLALVGTFAVAALLLAAIGLYGVMAYSVATRRREFGIRLAFGAARADLVRDVLIGAVTLTGIGLILGLAGAMGVARWMASELYQTRSGDPLVVVGTAAIVIAVAVLSSWIPAWRASALEPSEALRAQ